MTALETNVGPIHLERPAMLASGILGISIDVLGRIHKAGAGAMVTKSLSIEPWEGYVNPTVVGVGSGGWINAVGLSNPGAAKFAEMMSGVDLPIIVSLVGSVPQDFEDMIEKFRNHPALGYEINLSCPHVAHVGLEVGDDTGLVRDIIGTIKSATDAPVIAKVGLGNTHYIKTVQAAADAGADAITAINTIRALAIDVTTQKPVLSNGIGGLSGKPIKPVAVRCVYEIASSVDIPIIGCGGVAGWEDAVEFILAGASAVQVGSAVGDEWVGIFDEINRGIAQYMEQKGYRSIREMVGAARP